MTRALSNNDANLRKRRLQLELSPEFKVPTKFRVTGAKFNISQRLDSPRLVPLPLLFGRRWLFKFVYSLAYSPVLID